MLQRADDWLIDKVFQKIADRLSFLGSCYAISAFILTGSALAHFWFCIQTEDWLRFGLNLCWLPRWVWRAYALERAAQRDALPVERITDHLCRVVIVILMTGTLPFFIHHLFSAPSISLTVLEVAWWGFVCGMYFMACRPLPPAKRKSSVWFGWLRPHEA